MYKKYNKWRSFSARRYLLHFTLSKCDCTQELNIGVEHQCDIMLWTFGLNGFRFKVDDLFNRNAQTERCQLIEAIDATVNEGLLKRCKEFSKHVVFQDDKFKRTLKFFD